MKTYFISRTNASLSLARIKGLRIFWSKVHMSFIWLAWLNMMSYVFSHLGTIEVSPISLRRMFFPLSFLFTLRLPVPFFTFKLLVSFFTFKFFSLFSLFTFRLLVLLFVFLCSFLSLYSVLLNDESTDVIARQAKWLSLVFEMFNGREFIRNAEKQKRKKEKKK